MILINKEKLYMCFDFEYEEYIIEKGYEVRSLMRSYGIDIDHFRKENYLKDWSEDSELLFPFELGLQEYRVSIGRVYTMEMFSEDYGTTDINEYKEYWKRLKLKDEFPKEHEKEFFDDKEIAEKEGIKMFSQDVVFSVFVHENESDMLKLAKTDPEKYEDFISYCAGKGYEYFCSILAEFGNRYDSFDYDTAFTDHVEDFKRVLKDQYIEVNNDNIEVIKHYSYRLYKDSKFFYDFKREIRGTGSYESFMKSLHEL